MPSTDAWRWQKHHTVAGCLAVVGGYADVISLLRWKCFASMLTGNVIWLGRVLLGHSQSEGELHGPLFYLSLIIAFFLGAALFRWAEKTWPHRGATRVAPLLGLVNVICEVCFLVFVDQPRQRVAFFWQIVLYSPLFGVVCAASSDGRLGTPTIIATGHVVNLTKVLVDWPVKAPTFAERQKAIMSLIVVTGIALGALLAKVAYRLNGHNAVGLFVPVSPLLVFLLWCHDHLARPRSLVKIYQKALRARQRYQEALEAGEQGAISEGSDSDSESDSDEDEDDENNQEEEGETCSTDPLAIPAPGSADTLPRRVHRALPTV